MGATTDLTQLVKVYWSLLLGNIVEWYEFAVYGYLEVYMAEHFFHGSAIATWLGFSVTFLARPLGGVALGVLGDALGRRAAVNVAIVGMLVGTCGQGLLPTYSSGCPALGHLGLGLLVALRFLQGLSAAGEISTISTYLAEVAPPASMGRGVALVSMTCNLGFMAAKAVEYAVCRLLGAEAMMRWGWRLPFLFAIVPGLVAVWGRRRLPESDEFLQEQGRKQGPESCQAGEEHPGGEKEESPSHKGPPEGAAPRCSCSILAGILEVLGSHGRNVLVGMGGVASFAVLQYGGFVWMQSYLQQRGLTAGGAMLANLCARSIMTLLALPVGWLADIRGVGWVTFVGGLLLAAGGLPLFAALAAHPADLRVVLWAYGVGLALLGAFSGTVFFHFVVELFPTAVRSTAMGLSYNLGFSLFGGLAPIAAQASLGLSPHGPGYLLSLGGLITAGTVLCGVCLQRRGHLRLAHVREAPYFSPPGLGEVGRPVAARAAATPTAATPTAAPDGAMA